MGRKYKNNQRSRHPRKRVARLTSRRIAVLRKASAAEISRLTRISKVRIAKLRRGALPTTREAKKLDALYRRSVYLEARKVGLSPEESRQVSSWNPEFAKNYLLLRKSGVIALEARDVAEEPVQRVREHARKVKEFARLIARGNRKPLKVVLDGMRRSLRTVDDWELYVQARISQKWKPLTPEQSRTLAPQLPLIE